MGCIMKGSCGVGWVLKGWGAMGHEGVGVSCRGGVGHVVVGG